MATFGAKPELMTQLWKMINPEATMPTGAKPLHMLWIFYFFKQYPTEEVLASSLGGYDEMTCRKWIWLFVEAISFQEYCLVSEE